MRFRVVPRSVSFTGVFAGMGDTAQQAVDVLAELCGTPVPERGAVRDRLQALTVEADDTAQEIMRRLYSSFITPFDRSDIHALCRALTDCVDHVHSTGDLIVVYRLTALPGQLPELVAILARQAELTGDAMRRLSRPRDLAGYWVEIHRLQNEAKRVHRRALAEIFDSAVDLPTLMKQRELLAGLGDAALAFEAVSSCVQAIAAKES